MFVSRVRADAGSDRSPWGSWWFQPVGLLSSSGVRVTAGNAMALPAVYAAVRVLAESFAVLPFVLYRPKANGGRQRITDHWLYRLFAKAPNRFQSPFEFREMLQGHLALRGNAFCQITANGAGEIVELLPLHPDRMQLDVLPDGNFRYRYTDQSGEVHYYRRDEIWHLRGLSGDGIVGLSPIEIAREAIGEGLSMQSYSNRFFANDAKPGGGWIEYPGFFANKDARKAFREQWQESQGGMNRGKVAVLERGMKFHEIGVNNADAQFVEARAAKTTEIARIFRIPPHKLMDLSRSTNNNIEQQAIEFWQDCMLPWSERWEASIECFLLGADTDLEVEFDMRRMMRGDAIARSQYISTLVNAGVLVRNEGRDMEGYDPIDGLDEPLRPLNMIEEGQDTPAAGSGDTDSTDGSPLRSRLLSMLRSNAARMARRISGGSVPTAEVLAESLAVDQRAAAEWLTKRTSNDELELTASLVALGEQ